MYMFMQARFVNFYILVCFIKGTITNRVDPAETPHNASRHFSSMYKPYNHIPHSKSNKREQGDVGVNDIN